MNHTIVSWTKFCEWVQGKKVRIESSANRYSVVAFEDGTEAVMYSEYDVRFGEKSFNPPTVSIREKSP